MFAPASIHSHGGLRNQKPQRIEPIQVWNWNASKRSLEQAHVFIWATKDFLWMRSVSEYFVLVFGFTALILQLFTLGIDIRELLWEWRNRTSFFKEALEEMFLTLSMFFWLISNTTWAFGECKGLRESAIYDDVYYRLTGYGEYIIYFAIFFCILYFILALIPDNVPLWTLRSQRSYLNREKSDDEASGGLWYAYSNDSLCQSVQEDLTKEFLSPQSRSPTASAETHEEPMISSAVFSVLDKTALLVYLEPNSNLNTMENLAAIDDAETVNPYHAQMSFEKQAVQNRHLEEVFMFMWILKDLTWMLEWTYSWSICAVSILGCILWIIYDTQYLNRGESEGDQSFMVLFIMWISSNVLWAFGELYFDDEIPGIPSGNVKKDLAYEIPSMFSITHLLRLTPCWELRWIASWILLIGLLFTVIDAVARSRKSSST